MKWFLRGVYALALVLGVGSVLPAPTVQAAEGFNVVTSPLPIKITTPPGKTVETELRIKNQGTQAEGIKVGLMKFAATGETGQPDLFDLTPKDTYASWVQFSPEQILAQPNVWNSIKMTITVPADAGLGYYLAVTYSPSNVAGVAHATSLKGSAATLVLLDVKVPNEKRALNLVDFSTDHKLYEYLPATFNIKIHNSGNIYVPPAGNIFILRGDKTIETLDFNSAGGSVLPKSNRVFKLPWDNGFPHYAQRLVNGKPVSDHKGVPEQNLKWDFTQANKLRFGKYSARLLIAYDDGTHDVPLESTLSFWVIPWKLLILLLLLVALIGFGVFVLVRSTIRKARNRTGKLRRGKQR